jgi:phospholipid/cholesterol/gamma-HCH transport system substrate-binding protein
VGALMLAGIGALIVVIVLAGGRPGLFAPGIDLEARFHRVNGLQAGAPVALFGMTVGAVEQISFSADPTADYVVVRMWIEHAAARRLHADSEAEIETIGLLGDKFVELTPGTPQAGVIRPGAALHARDPVDYEALVGRQNTRDFLTNIYFIAGSMRVLLEQLQNGRGLLSELIRGDENGGQLSLANLRQTLEHIDRASAALQRMLDRAADDRSLAGALLSNKNDGRKMISDIAASVASLRASAARLDGFSARVERARGLIPRLVEDSQLADRLIGELDRTSRQLERILYKIDAGQGTLGKMINDPTLYFRADSLLSGGGWGLSLMRGLYGISHPFSPSLSPSQSVSSVACTCSRASDPGDPAATDPGSTKEFAAPSSSAASP